MGRSAKLGIILFINVFSCLLVFAEPTSQLKPSNYVNDFAQILDDKTQRQLNDIAQQVDQKAHAQIAVAVINSLDGSDIESYAVDLFKRWGVGDKSSKRGVLILLAVKDRRYRIEVGYGLEPILPDGKVGGFGREAVPFLRQNDYNGAILLMVTRVASVIAQDSGVEISSVPIPKPKRDSRENGFSFSTIVMVLVGIAVISYLMRGASSGINRRGRGGFYGGGWGGGFGGFGAGGGSWGGGGASGSW
jgi:uncharacterized protein